MTQARTLKTLEILLESFLERAVVAKEKRMTVMAGINRLDDIAVTSVKGDDITDRIGEWFAEHNNWLTDSSLKPDDLDRISGLLESIDGRLGLSSDESPAAKKIKTEIGRWTNKPDKSTGKIVLTRAPEAPEKAAEDSTGLRIDQTRDTIGNFELASNRSNNLFKDFSGNKKHLLSVLDESLKSAVLQKNKEALLLSAQIIYYLKIDGYKVEPYVIRLRASEKIIKGDLPDA